MSRTKLRTPRKQYRSETQKQITALRKNQTKHWIYKKERKTYSNRGTWTGHGRSAHRNSCVVQHKWHRPLQLLSRTEYCSHERQQTPHYAKRNGWWGGGGGAKVITTKTTRWKCTQLLQKTMTGTATMHNEYGHQKITETNRTDINSRFPDLLATNRWRSSKLSIHTQK